KQNAEIERIEGENGEAYREKEVVQPDPDKVHRRSPRHFSSRAGKILRDQVGGNLKNKPGPNDPRQDDRAEDEEMDEQGRRTGFSPPPLHQIKQRDPPEKGECVRVGVKGNAQERRDHERAMPGADRLPSQQNENAGEGFWPRTDPLADEISIDDINER